MNFDEIGRITSFSSHNKQKGLLTFYQQQWIFQGTDRKQQNYDNNQQMNYEQKKIDRKPYILNQGVRRIGNSNRFSTGSHSQKSDSNKKKQIVSKYQRKIISNSFGSNQMKQIQKSKSSKKQLIKYPYLIKIKNSPNEIKTQNAQFLERKKLKNKVNKLSYQMIKIKNYPFQQKQNQHQDSFVENYTRIKKGSSFKGSNLINPHFHGEGLLKSISKSIFLDSILLNQLKQQQRKYEAYHKTSKKSPYLFPILCQQQNLPESIGEKHKQKAHQQKCQKDLSHKIKKRTYRYTDILHKYSHAQLINSIK